MGFLLLLGLGTPLVAAVQVLTEGWLALAGGALNLDHNQPVRLTSAASRGRGWQSILERTFLEFTCLRMTSTSLACEYSSGWRANPPWFP